MTTVVSKVGISSKENREFRQWKEEQMRLTKIENNSLMKEQQNSTAKIVRCRSKEQRAELFAKKKISSNQRAWQPIDVKGKGVIGKMVDAVKVYDSKNQEFFTRYYPSPVRMIEALKDVNVAKIMSHTLTSPEFLLPVNY